MRGARMAHILLMEDDKPFADLVADSLVGAGHEVVLASDGTDALELTEVIPFDLLITDIIVRRDGRARPDGGIFVIGKLRNEQFLEQATKRSSIPIIAISGQMYNAGMADILFLANSVGADLVLAKPFEPAELIDSVETLLKVSGRKN